MTPGERLDGLDRSIGELKVEYEKFFNGARAVPPEDLREAVRHRIRALRAANLRGLAERFRLGQLEARFVTLGELWTRRLREAEEGRAPGSGSFERAPQLDPLRGVVVGGRVETEEAEALYAGLAVGSADSPRFDLESFRVYLERQVGAIREKTGCERVRFRLEPDGERMKLKARPLGGSGAKHPGDA